MKNFILIVCMALGGIVLAQNEKPQVIPVLQQWEGGHGFFDFSKKTNLVFNTENQQIKPSVEQFAYDIFSEYHYKNKVTSQRKNKNEIYFSLTDKELPFY